MKPVARRLSAPLSHQFYRCISLHPLRSPISFIQRQYSIFDLSTDQEIDEEKLKKELASIVQPSIKPNEEVKQVEDAVDDKIETEESPTSNDEAKVEVTEFEHNYQFKRATSFTTSDASSEEEHLKKLIATRQYDKIIYLLNKTRNRSPVLLRFGLQASMQVHYEQQLQLLIQLCTTDEHFSFQDIRTIEAALFKYRGLESFIIPILLLIPTHNLPAVISSVTRKLLQHQVFAREKFLREFLTLESVFQEYIPRDLRIQLALRKVSYLYDIGLKDRVNDVIVGFELEPSIKKALASKERVRSSKEAYITELQKSSAKMDREYAEFFSRLEDLLLASNLDVSEQVFQIVKKKKFSYAGQVMLVYMQQLIFANRVKDAFELLPIYYSQENRRREDIFQLLMERLLLHYLLLPNKTTENYQETRSLMMQVMEHAKQNSTAQPLSNYLKITNELAVIQKQWQDIETRRDSFDRNRTILDAIFRDSFPNHYSIIVELMEANKSYFLDTTNSGDFNSYFNILLQTYLELGQFTKAKQVYKEYAPLREKEFDFVTLSTINTLKEKMNYNKENI